MFYSLQFTGRTERQIALLRLLVKVQRVGATLRVRLATDTHVVRRPVNGVPMEDRRSGRIVGRTAERIGCDTFDAARHQQDYGQHRHQNVNDGCGSDCV